MELEAAYLNAALPEPVRLLGQQLLPYSLGHEYLLRRHNSPFVSKRPVTGEEILRHLFLGVFICCQSFAEAQRRLLAPGLKKVVASWRRRVLAHGRFDAVAKMEGFQGYIDEGSVCPRFNYVQRGGTPTLPGAPWLSLLLNTLTGDLHWTFEAAMDCPYAHAQWLYCAHLEFKGRIRIVSVDQEMELEMIREEAAKRGWVLAHCHQQN